MLSTVSLLALLNAINNTVNAVMLIYKHYISLYIYMKWAEAFDFGKAVP